MSDTVPSIEAIIEKRHFARCWMRCRAFFLVGLGSAWLLYDLVMILIMLAGSLISVAQMPSFDEV